MTGPPGRLTYPSTFIPKEFIRSRSTLIGALMNDLTIVSKPKASDELKEGCGLSRILAVMPQSSG